MRLTDACVILGVEPRELGSREVVKAAHRTAMERYGQENKNSTLLEEAKTNIEDFWASLDRYEPNRDYSDKTENYLRRRDKEHQEFMIEMARGFRNERGELDEELLFCLEMLVRAHRTGGVKVETIQGELKIIFPADMLVAQNYHNEVMKKREAEEAAKRELEKRMQRDMERAKEILDLKSKAEQARIERERKTLAQNETGLPTETEEEARKKVAKKEASRKKKEKKKEREVERRKKKEEEEKEEEQAKTQADDNNGPRENDIGDKASTNHTLPSAQAPSTSRASIKSPGRGKKSLKNPPTDTTAPVIPSPSPPPAKDARRGKKNSKYPSADSDAPIASSPLPPPPATTPPASTYVEATMLAEAKALAEKVKSSRAAPPQSRKGEGPAAPGKAQKKQQVQQGHVLEGDKTQLKVKAAVTPAKTTPAKTTPAKTTPAKTSANKT
eukprot:CAMPEP_0197549142 /NCGR_PEP_ID=MMETSP1320-20131121/3112_1 /TAXON_ID=91990 /ORGANISM="Bolidomonas sp., Strain RCC2347" /LENGTH=442 /DNA_ID=CAMNT_0043109309 /DNA_START=70 /DNA_END=1394 /DNA_ORIENTATION=+